MKSHIVSAIETHKIIAILRGIPAEKLIQTAEALIRGGIRLLEITYDASAKISDEETAKTIDLFAKVINESTDGSIPEWVQPDSTNAYSKGDKVSYNGHIYESIIDGNVWSPDAYPQGWQLIE